MLATAPLTTTLACTAVFAGLIGQSLTVTFRTSEEALEEARDEYETLWSLEGERMVAVLEGASELRFAVDAIDAEVIEGPSWAGRDRIGMRASYPADTKRATLAHELGHILIGDLLPDRDEAEDVPDDHYVLFLFLYDAWIELWGTEFADAQVAVESARRGGTDYEGIWRQVLAKSAPARAAEWRAIVDRWGGLRAPAQAPRNDSIGSTPEARRAGR